METAEKKILLLNGSPRREKSTTLLAANAFIEGMKDGGNYSIETVHVCASCRARAAFPAGVGRRGNASSAATTFPR